MQLECLPDGAEECPVVRLFDFTADEIRRLQVGIEALASSAGDQVAVAELPGVSSVDGCRLSLVMDAIDFGMVAIEASKQFVCALTPDSWGEVAGLLEPFVLDSAGFQWLCVSGDARWLISRTGSW